MIESECIFAFILYRTLLIVSRGGHGNNLVSFQLKMNDLYV